MPEEDFYANFTHADGTDRLISHGQPSGQISLKITAERLFILVEGEPSGNVLTACFREALASGHSQIDKPAIVDLTRFRGDVDWAAIRAIRDMAPWTTPRTAYVVRPHTMFDLVIKIVATIFVNAQHRIFHCQKEALSWLGDAPAKSG